MFFVIFVYGRAKICCYSIFNFDQWKKLLRCQRTGLGNPPPPFLEVFRPNFNFQSETKRICNNALCTWMCRSCAPSAAQLTKLTKLCLRRQSVRLGLWLCSRWGSVWRSVEQALHVWKRAMLPQSKFQKAAVSCRRSELMQRNSLTG